MRSRIAIVIPYFGEWPPWTNFFVESCRSNASIDWLLFNDAEPPQNKVRNVKHVRMTFEEYKSHVSDALGIHFDPAAPYKLCDIRPALAFIHADRLASYDFVGFGDIDVIYGNIRSFYDDDLLAAHDLLSTHSDRISGHFCLMRNSDDVINAFRRVAGWAKSMQEPDYVAFDERRFYNLFRGRRARIAHSLGFVTTRCFFREAYSTPGATSSMRWYWKDGELRSEFYPHHPFMYLHFMSWHSNRWYADQTGVDPSAAAPWDLLPSPVQMDWRLARESGFMIGPDGIEPAVPSRYP